MGLPLRIAASLLTRPGRHRFGDDPSQVADLHVPSGDGPFPVAVVLHGGYWQTRYGKLIMRPLALDLVRRGWAAWNVEYRRLGTGRGGGGGWPMTFDDVGAGVDLLASLGDPRLDLDRVVALGHSAGGQLALWAAGRDPAAAAVRVGGVLALAPVTNLAASGATARALMGGSVQQVPERYDAADPLRRAPLGVPVRIVHAVDDATIPVPRSREYVVVARLGEADAVLAEVPSGGHRSVIDPASDAWATAAAALDELGAGLSPRAGSRS
jgi:acetyl esterase/lipase